LPFKKNTYTVLKKLRIFNSNFNDFSGFDKREDAGRDPVPIVQPDVEERERRQQRARLAADGQLPVVFPSLAHFLQVPAQVRVGQRLRRLQSGLSAQAAAVGARRLPHGQGVSALAARVARQPQEGQHGARGPVRGRRGQEFTH